MKASLCWTGAAIYSFNCPTNNVPIQVSSRRLNVEIITYSQSSIHHLPCNSCFFLLSVHSSYICNLSWQQASLIIDSRVTKIEQTLHHGGLLDSEWRKEWSIVNPVAIIIIGGGNECAAARSDLRRSQRSAGIPWPWKGARWMRRKKRGRCGTGLGVGRPAGWFVCDSALPRLLLPDLRPAWLPAMSLSSGCLPAATHADTSLYLLMAFPGSSWQHSHYLWAGGPLQRLLMQALKLSSLCIIWLALIKSKESQYCKCCACLNHLWDVKMAGGVSWQMRVSMVNLFPRDIDFRSLPYLNQMLFWHEEKEQRWWTWGNWKFITTEWQVILHPTPRPFPATVLLILYVVIHTCNNDDFNVFC